MGENVFPVRSRFGPLELLLGILLRGLIFLFPRWGFVVHVLHDVEHHVQQSFHKGILLVHLRVQVRGNNVEVNSERGQLIGFLIAVPVFPGNLSFLDVDVLLV
jgi:hypothetical protein